MQPSVIFPQLQRARARARQRQALMVDEKDDIIAAIKGAAKRALLNDLSKHAADVRLFPENRSVAGHTNAAFVVLADLDLLSGARLALLASHLFHVRVVVILGENHDDLIVGFLNALDVAFLFLVLVIIPGRDARKRAELMADKGSRRRPPVLDLSIDHNQRRRIICGAADCEISIRHVDLAVALDALDLTVSLATRTIPSDIIANAQFVRFRTVLHFSPRMLRRRYHRCAAVVYWSRRFKQKRLKIIAFKPFAGLIFREEIHLEADALHQGFSIGDAVDEINALTALAVHAPEAVKALRVADAGCVFALIWARLGSILIILLRHQTRSPRLPCISAPKRPRYAPCAGITVFTGPEALGLFIDIMPREIAIHTPHSVHRQIALVGNVTRPSNAHLRAAATILTPPLKAALGLFCHRVSWYRHSGPTPSDRPSAPSRLGSSGYCLPVEAQGSRCRAPH